MPAVITFAVLSHVGPSQVVSILAASDCAVESFAYVCAVLYLYACAVALLLGMYSRHFLWICELNPCEGELFFPNWFLFRHVFYGTHLRFDCSHISNMRLDQ